MCKLLWSGLQEGSFLPVGAMGHQRLPPLRPRLPTAFCCSHWLPHAFLVSSLHLWNIPCPYPPLHPLPTLLLSSPCPSPWPSELPSVSMCSGWSVWLRPTISPQLASRDICVSTTLAAEPTDPPKHTFRVLLAPFCSPPAWRLAWDGEGDHYPSLNALWLFIPFCHVEWNM